MCRGQADNHFGKDTTIGKGSTVGAGAVFGDGAVMGPTSVFGTWPCISDASVMIRAAPGEELEGVLALAEVVLVQVPG